MARANCLLLADCLGCGEAVWGLCGIAVPCRLGELSISLYKGRRRGPAGCKEQQRWVGTFKTEKLFNKQNKHEDHAGKLRTQTREENNHLRAISHLGIRLQMMCKQFLK